VGFFTWEQLLTMGLVLIWSIFLLWRKEWRLPGLILALVLEISKTWFTLPFLDQSAATSAVLVDLTRITIGIIILGWFWKWVRKRPQIMVFDGVVPFMIAVLLAVILTSSRQVAFVELIRYTILFLLAISVAELFSEDATVRQFTLSIAVIGAVVGIMGLLEYLMGWHYWPDLPASYTPRAQATFVDPNIYARFLAIALLWTLYWWLEEKHWGAVLLGIAQLFGLAVSMSRGGWISLGVAILILVVLKRDRVLMLFSGGILVLGVGMSLLNPVLRTRILSVFNGGEALGGTRMALLKAGWDMFKTNPLQGVGLGNFQYYFGEHYRKLLPTYIDVSRSHTSVMTIAAEMGLMGILALAYFIYAVVRSVRRLLRSQDNVALFILLSLVVIFVSSQGEGRFFEDPWLWIMVGWLTQRENYARKWLS